ncbi:hypothetical protein [Calidifontibacter indicus]|uniref:hypothetical protein n=1 Tax=Calidifontibacter indicus TaxID=419650 RepID=UPI003D74601F
MGKRTRITFGIVLIALAIGAQALRLLADDSLAWLPPATIATTWICLLGGAALVVSGRNEKNTP